MNGQSGFLATYSPYAQSVGSNLGIAPSSILAQWALESGWGTSSAAQQNNLAGLSPGGSLASYESPAAFAQAYQSTLANNFPNTLNTGSNVSAFNAGLLSGTNGAYYSSSPASYLSNLQALTQQINSSSAASPVPFGAAVPLPPGYASPLALGGAIVPQAQAAAFGGGGLFSWASNFAFRGAVAVIAIILVGIGVASLALKSKPTQIAVNALSKVGG